MSSVSQCYSRRVACQHFPDDQTLRLQAGAGEDDVIHLPSGLDRVDCERQEEEDSVTDGVRLREVVGFLEYMSRVPVQNGVFLLHIKFEIHHSGR